MTLDTHDSHGDLSLRRIFQTWWPLALSWMLMGAEMPALSAIVARLANPEINLAAYGGIVFPLALIIESPIIMLLAASTALSKDWTSFAKVKRFMMVTSAALTVFHLLVVFTPIYELIARDLLHQPAEIIEPARTGLLIMTPWTWSIAYRRFHQGVLIRFGRTRAVSMGTVVRLSADLLVLAIGFLLKDVPGIVVATGAVAFGVVSEAVFVGIIVRPIVHGPLRAAPPVSPPLTLRTFLAFYFPLVMTSLLGLLAMPVGSAAMGRMPQPLESLAAWPVVGGLVFLVRGLGIAFNEVVVALLDEPRSSRNLRRFSGMLVAVSSSILILLTATPLAGLYFTEVSALSTELSNLARTAMWVTLPLPAFSVLQSWYQGAILHSRSTRPITEAVVIYLVINIVTQFVGVIWGKTTGLYIGLGSLMLSTLGQTAWLWLRSRRAIHEVRIRDAALLPVAVSEAS